MATLHLRAPSRSSEVAYESAPAGRRSSASAWSRPRWWWKFGGAGVCLGATVRARGHHARWLYRADSGLTGSFRAFVGDFRPKLLQRPRCRLVLMSFGVVRSPGILIRLPRLQFRLVHRGRTPPRPAAPAAKIRSPARKPGFKSVKNGHHSEPHIQVDWLRRARSGCGSFFLMLPTIGAGRPA